MAMRQNWQIIEDHFDPASLHHRETVFTIGNGYLGTRGAFEEGYPEQEAATLVHGVFDDIPIVYTELANAPDWLNLEIWVNGARFRLDQGRLLSYHRSLDLSNGALKREVRWQSPRGETMEVEFERFASLADEHLLAIRCQVRALDFSGTLEVRAGLNGHVDNEGFTHWVEPKQGLIAPQQAFLEAHTRATHIDLCAAFYLDVNSSAGARYDFWDSHGIPTLVGRTAVKPGDRVQAIKLVAIYTSRDTPDPKGDSAKKLVEGVALGYEALFKANQQAWEQEWQRCNIIIEGDDQADLALRYSLFQLLIAAPRHDERVSIAAKTLSGFGYRGHVFWDTEIFVLPFFIYTSPHIARNLLMYRYHTLPGARRKAQTSGYEGAMFAWESAASGDETTPRWVPTPHSPELTRIWCGDIEHHISADVAYAVQQYWQVSGDDAFMRDYGAEILLDTARFWGSRAEWKEAKGRYELTNVIGPDEYHDRVDNNAFTNNMARWNLQAGLEVLGWLEREHPEKAAELKSRLDLTEARLAHWQEVIDKIWRGCDPQSGLFEQFEGFFKLKSVNLADYEPRKISMQALLGIEGVQKYQIIKQPDVLMLLYLLREQCSPQTLKNNWDYYTPRTDLTYGSSLGPAIQGILAARLGEVQMAYQHFMHAARTDLEDARGNTCDGIHAATDGGLWQAAVFGFGGLETGAGGPRVQARLPECWRRLAFRIQYRGQTYDFDLRPAAQPKEQANRRKPKWPILGAIFDLDGVLTDTSELHYQAWKRLADEEGIPFDRQKNEALRGIARGESLRRLLDGRSFPKAQRQEMMERKNRYYLQSIARLTPQDLLPGGLDLLKGLRAAGIKVAIGSASKNAREVVEKLGLESWVDSIADGNSVERQKPAPDLFLHAARKLGLPPKQCVVFEDAEAGVEAAIAGGMWAVGIGPEARVGKAHLILKNLEGVTWEDIRQRLGEHVNQTRPGGSKGGGSRKRKEPQA
jgi:beta-phosphoglucomutase